MPFTVGVVANVFTPEPESVRLLYVNTPPVCAAPFKFTVPVDAVNVPDAKFPPTFIVPASVNVILDCAAVPEVVMAPVTLTVPVESDNVQYQPAVALPGIAMLAALNVPVPTSIVLVSAVGEVIVIALVTASVPGLVIVIPLVNVAFALTVILAHTAPAAFTVTTTPLLIVTASVEIGVAAEPAVPPAVVAHIAPVQLPVVTANRCAIAAVVIDSVKNSVVSKNTVSFFIILSSKKVIE
ncbi:MAG: hypothetical protein Q8O92_07590 [Candidatus Latescibacter sp.]|nr:hypothetical protein [Candidatus Latescibacter sp.]